MQVLLLLSASVLFALSANAESSDSLKKAAKPPAHSSDKFEFEDDDHIIETLDCLKNNGLVAETPEAKYTFRSEAHGASMFFCGKKGKTLEECSAEQQERVTIAVASCLKPKKGKTNGK